MTTYVMRDGQLVEKGEVVDPSVHYVISDSMEPTQHMATGKYVSSKSKFRQMTKDAGCVEVGNDVKSLHERRAVHRVPQLDKRERAQDIKRAIEQLRGR